MCSSDLDLFHQVTNNRYNSGSYILSLPDFLEIKVGVKGGLILFEESSINYKLNGSNRNLSVRMDFSYKGKVPALPSYVKAEAFNTQNTEDLMTFKKEFVNEIDYSKEHNPLRHLYDNTFDGNGKISYYDYTDDSSYHSASDGNSYLLLYRFELSSHSINNRDQLFVYDLKTFKLLYTVRFNGAVKDVICENGRVAIRLEVFIGEFPRSTGYSCYNLNDFSKIVDVGCEQCLIQDDKLFYSNSGPNEFIVWCVDLTTKNKSIIQRYYCEENMNAIYNLYGDKEQSVLVAAHRENDNLYHYFAINTKTNEKLYEKTASNYYYSYWTGRGEQGRYIDALTGEEIYYEGDELIDFNLSDVGSDCVAYQSKYEHLYINERYHIVKIQVYIYLEEYYKTEDQFWLYDKHENHVICRTEWGKANDIYILSDSCFILVRAKYMMVIML